MSHTTMRAVSKAVLDLLEKPEAKLASLNASMRECEDLVMRTELYMVHPNLGLPRSLPENDNRTHRQESTAQDAGQTITDVSKSVMELLNTPDAKTAVFKASPEERYELVRHINFYLLHPDWAIPLSLPEVWTPRETGERASHFYERVYAPMPFAERPYTHQLSNRDHGNRPLYEAIAMIITNNRRLDRTGAPGSLQGARSLFDVFPGVSQIYDDETRNALFKAACKRARAHLSLAIDTSEPKPRKPAAKGPDGPKPTT